MLIFTQCPDDSGVSLSVSTADADVEIRAARSRNKYLISIFEVERLGCDAYLMRKFNA